jgi:hypothetical protein
MQQQNESQNHIRVWLDVAEKYLAIASSAAPYVTTGDDLNSG